MKINGVAHIILTVSRPEISIPFYEKLLTFLEFEVVHKKEKGAYFVGGKTAIGVMPPQPGRPVDKYVQGQPGLHHLCWRAYSREDVDRFYQHLCAIGAKVIHPPEDGPWAPGYYSVLFEDPDGMRLEMNFVPGKGLFAENVRFNPVGYENWGG